MLNKTKVLVPVIVLLYPKPSQLLFSGIIAGYKVKCQSAQAEPENSERGGRNNCLLDTFYFAEYSIKTILYFKEKVVTAAPYGHP